MYRVLKKINNNLVLSKNDVDEEFILQGRGLGFAKTPYDLTDEKVIEKIYTIAQPKESVELFSQLPAEHLELTRKIIDLGNEILDTEVNPNIYLTLSDHIHYLLENPISNELVNPLKWTIKTVYKKEFTIGVNAVQLINDTFNIDVNEGEAVNIALHFINAMSNSTSMVQTTKNAQIVGEILNIIKFSMKAQFDEDSVDYARLATHVSYFVARKTSGQQLSQGDKEVIDFFIQKHNEEFAVVEKITSFLKKKFDWEITKEEQFYLLLHINRIIHK